MLRWLRDSLFGESASTSPAPRSTRLGIDRLEDRTVPAIIGFTVNTLDDTHFDHAILNELGQVVNVVDANNNTSLRAVVEYANTTPQNGIWNDNHFNVELGNLAGGRSRFELTTRRTRSPSRRSASTRTSTSSRVVVWAP